MDVSSLLWIVAVVLVVVGFAGTVLPMLPGIPLMLLGMFIAAWIGHFARVGPWTLGLLSVLTVLSIVVDLLASLLGARRVGASRLAVIGAGIGTVAGLFLGLAGLILGPFVGAVTGELIARRRLGRADAQAAVHVGIGAWLGFVLGSVAKLAIACAMLGVFAAAWYVD
jgi:hypothetical protein